MHTVRLIDGLLRFAKARRHNGGVGSSAAGVLAGRGACVEGRVSFPDRLTAKGRLLRVRAVKRKSKFSETQIVGILKDAESGVPVADLLRKYGVSKATFFKWRSKVWGRVGVGCEAAPRA